MASNPAVNILGTALLVSGTCIGAGMLSLPVSTAPSGFFITMIAFGISWFMMLCAAMLMLESSLWFPENSNFISMAHKILGKGGEALAWVTYLLFLYSLMATYTSGGSGIVIDQLSKYNVSTGPCVLAFVSVFALVIYFGLHLVDIINRWMMFALFISYFLLCYYALPHVELERLNQGEARYIWFSLPLLVTSFGFHLLIPSLKTYLHSNAKDLRWAIFIGSAIPLVIYVLWECFILGVVDNHGESGLIAIYHSGQPAVELTKSLNLNLNQPKITHISQSFVLSAILTSFLGVALSIFDFLADGLKIKKDRKGRLLLILMTFAPGALYALFKPKGFLFALGYAGVFASLLLVIFPAIMVYRGRYHLNLPSNPQLFGKKAMIFLVLAFGLGVISLKVFECFDLLPLP